MSLACARTAQDERDRTATAPTPRDDEARRRGFWPVPQAGNSEDSMTPTPTPPPRWSFWGRHSIPHGWIKIREVESVRTARQLLFAHGKPLASLQKEGRLLVASPAPCRATIFPWP